MGRGPVRRQLEWSNSFRPTREQQYRLEADYSRPRLEIQAPQAARIRERLGALYGSELAWSVYLEVERLLQVHAAHATPEIDAAEAAFDPAERFSEKDLVLITYGDLVVAFGRTPLQTLADFTRAFFGGVISTIHILPFFPYSSDRGFSVLSYEEVDPRLGTWDEIAKLGRSFKLMFDGVFNHVSAKSYWFQQFLAGDRDYADYFISFSSQEAIDQERLQLVLRPRTSSLLSRVETLNGPRWVWTTFSPDQVDLNFHKPKVLLKTLEILLYYVRRGADLIRLDAVTYLWYELGTSCAHLRQTHEVVKLYRDVLDVVAPHVALITETNVPHADNITYFGNGTDEAQMVYNFALPPLVLHSFHTGDATSLAGWARTLTPPAPGTAFFNFLDSHDGIGLQGARGILTDDQIFTMCDRVRANGGFVSYSDDGKGGVQPYELNTTWFSALNGDPAEVTELHVARFVASRTVALVLRGVPGIYLPSLVGSRNDIGAVQREGHNRAINRAEISEPELFELLGDPTSTAARVARRHTELLLRRVSEPAFHPSAPQEILELDRRVLAVCRIAVDGSYSLVCLINVSSERVSVSVPHDAIGPAESGVADLLSDRFWPAGDAALTVDLDPYDVVWLKADSAGSPAFLTGVRRERPEMPMMVGARRAEEPSRS